MESVILNVYFSILRKKDPILYLLKIIDAVAIDCDLAVFQGHFTESHHNTPIRVVFANIIAFVIISRRGNKSLAIPALKWRNLAAAVLLTLLLQRLLRGFGLLSGDLSPRMRHLFF
ncbi:MAG: hypothetical protein CMK92_05400 [Pseudomonas sp.]|nr:hypothetical protein [Pseudomonas sp.]